MGEQSDREGGSDRGTEVTSRREQLVMKICRVADQKSEEDSSDAAVGNHVFDRLGDLLQSLVKAIYLEGCVCQGLLTGFEDGVFDRRDVADEAERREWVVEEVSEEVSGVGRTTDLGWLALGRHKTDDRLIEDGAE